MIAYLNWSIGADRRGRTTARHGEEARLSFTNDQSFEQTCILCPIRQRRVRPSSKVLRTTKGREKSRSDKKTDVRYFSRVWLVDASWRVCCVVLFVSCWRRNVERTSVFACLSVCLYVRMEKKRMNECNVYVGARTLVRSSLSLFLSVALSPSTEREKEQD